MDTYINKGDYVISEDKTQTIPKAHWFYQDILADVAAGTAKIVEPAVDLPSVKSAACNRIDAKAEALRNTVLTPGSGQMAAYQTKESQATALLADASPTSAKYPDIYNEVGITADTATDVAKAVQAAAEGWRVFGRAVEKARLAGKKAVNVATDVAGVTAAEVAIVWPTV